MLSCRQHPKKHSALMPNKADEIERGTCSRCERRDATGRA
jgi:hypothetical protein